MTWVDHQQASLVECQHAKTDDGEVQGPVQQSNCLEYREVAMKPSS